MQGNPETQVVNPFAVIIRDYQKYVWLPGTIYGLILLAGLGGIVLAWRRLGGEALLPWAISLALIVVPAATAEFDYRYVLPAVPFACLAAVIAFSPGTAGGAWARAASGRGAADGRRERRRTGSRPGTAAATETANAHRDRPGHRDRLGSPRRRAARRPRPATTSVISPRTAPEPAQAASSARVPRQISSWVLVSSRQTTACRSAPCEAASSVSVSASLRPDSK